MKIARTVLLIACILVTIFFVVYANIQTSLAKEEHNRANMLAQEAVALQEVAEREAANAREAEAQALMAMEMAEECRLELELCKGQ